MTVILLTCSYDGREFVRVGYYVNNEYTDEALNAEPPAKPVIDKVQRNILAEKPRVTRFAIKWDSDESAPAEYPPEQPEADVAEDDGNQYGAEEEEEEEEVEAEAEGAKVEEGEDAAMAGGDDANGPQKEEDEASDAGSEDLEEESEGSDDEEDEEEEGEGEEQADEDMADGQETSTAKPIIADKENQQHTHQQADVMVH